MATAFDELAGVRPRIRRDVLFTRTPGGVLFHNADGGFHLAGRGAYRFATLVVPHLDGSRPLAEICAGVGEQQRAMVAKLVGSLLERDFARDAAPARDAEAGLPEAVRERFAAQIAYVDHYTDDAQARFARFRATSVAVLGEGEVAAWCALSLVRNGCARVDVEADAPAARAEADEAAEAGSGARVTALPGGGDLAAYDVVVVTGADALARTRRLLDDGPPPGQLVLPVWTFGELAVVGPRGAADSVGCVSCALLRFGATLDAATAAGLWSELASGARPSEGAPGGPLAGPVAAMLGNLLSYEIFRTATGALPAETDGQILVQDLDSLDVTAEPLRPHPRCRRCTPGAPADTLPGALAVARTTTVETARDAEELVAELNRLSTALVRPHAGVFTRWEDEELTQIPLKAARLELPLGPGGTRLIAAFDVHHLAGARRRALRAAALAYTEHAVPAAVLPGGPGELPVMRPGALTCGTGRGAEGVAAWSAVTSLLTKERAAVPAAAVRPAGPHNRDLVVQRGPAGAGAGETPQEAAGHALLSALAHDALLRAVRGAATVRPIPPPPGDGDAELVFLHRTAETLGARVEVLDLGEDARSGAHAVLARRAADDEGGAEWAVACDLTAGAAATAALRDLLGTLQVTAGTGTPPDTGDPLLPDLAPGAIAVTDPAGRAGPEATFPALLDRLRAAGRDVLYADTTPPDLRAGGLYTARVLLTSGGSDADR
ncbi:TOMM precursor leader peptide-binding protein [Streptomyces avicenniae]|uniref:TOMM precursor leader peptide-binding protein n=1 Tax=Streptomyces avicenniae TaxID=500153 RepID=UPI00069BF0AA|nr:TOMM precursor leader peptide-binding protein [Streptomyces avicenniae]